MRRQPSGDCLHLPGLQGAGPAEANALRVATPPVVTEASSQQPVVVASELTRGIFARKLVPGKVLPPITTDSETIVQLWARGGGDELLRRLRLASYLQPLDPLFFEARGRSVSLSNYNLKLKRLSNDAAAGSGAVQPALCGPGAGRS